MRTWNCCGGVPIEILVKYALSLVLLEKLLIFKGPSIRLRVRDEQILNTAMTDIKSKRNIYFYYLYVILKMLDLYKSGVICRVGRMLLYIK